MKTLPIIVGALIFSFFTKGNLKAQEVIGKDSIKAKAPFVSENICGDSLIAFAKQFLGTKYKYANCSPTTGFDCSGFVHYVFKHFNVSAPRSSKDYGSLKPVIPQDSAQIGDVIVFTGTNAKIRKPGHVGIVISKKGSELTFIHASSNKKRGGVIISTYVSSPYYEKRFLKVIRLPMPVLQDCNEKH